MFRLIRLTLLLIVVCAAAILAAHLIGGTRPNPLAILFTNPDGTPCPQSCLFGIKPGMTYMEEAVGILKSHPLTKDLKTSALENGYEFSGVGVDVFIGANESNPTVSRITLRRYLLPTSTNLPVPSQSLMYPLKTTSMGDIVAIYGSPSWRDAAGLTRASIYFFYSAQQAVIWGLEMPDADRIDTNLPLYGISFETDWNYQVTGSNWLGFASYEYCSRVSARSAVPYTPDSPPAP